MCVHKCHSIPSNGREDVSFKTTNVNLLCPSRKRQGITKVGRIHHLATINITFSISVWTKVVDSLTDGQDRQLSGAKNTSPSESLKLKGFR